MALVGRSHDGDAGGDPPSPNWNPKLGCAAIGAKQKRGAALNRKLQEKRRAHGGPLPVEFDINDKGTYMPVGPNHTEFSNLCGSLARRAPLHHDAWVQVPAGEKAHVMPELEDYFDLSPYKKDPYVMNAIDQLVASRYRGAKTNFKSKHFTARGGLDKVGELRDQPPANISPEAWHQLMDAYVREDNVARAQRNKGNREHQSYISMWILCQNFSCHGILHHDHT